MHALLAMATSQKTKDLLIKAAIGIAATAVTRIANKVIDKAFDKPVARRVTLTK